MSLWDVIDNYEKLLINKTSFEIIDDKKTNIFIVSTLSAADHRAPGYLQLQ